MATITILGGGRLGRAIEGAFLDRSDNPRVLGRPAGRRHDPAALAGSDLVVDASTGSSVAGNVEAALDAGCRRFLIAATGWDADAVAGPIAAAGAVAVAAPNLSLGAAVFLRLVERASALLAPFEAFDPFVVEWHRRGKRDRPSGTALELVRRLRADAAVDVASVRAGASPGMHLVGFDSPGETIELRLTARDRSAYAGGALVAADWLLRGPRRPGLHSFDRVVDDLLTTPAAAPGPELAPAAATA